ncbi:zeaxanthin 7,8(7',8')-cleavage dioxygenase, chromoplastic-like [Nymphaea colorata]|nr:zeaxanthin 7,8(7',8')-cleavage dioxygenase, chromoplastic-like [Nymphaea colorata]
MDAISSPFLAPFPQLSLSSVSPKTTPSRITFPTITNVRIEERPQTQLKPQSPAATATTTTTTTIAAPPPPSSKERINGRRAEAPSLPLEQARLVRLPSRISSPPSLPVTICNILDDLINNFIDRPLRSSINPKDVLANNCAPVGELLPTKCTVQGRLPSCLDGAYIRNGPNPRFVPRAGYHLFDGDGMLHAMRISSGQATFCSRFVRTYKFTQEEEAGSPIYPNYFAGFEGAAGLARGGVLAVRALTGQFNPLNGAGLANTSLVFMDNKLMALGESDLPYEVRVTPDGDVETIGQWNFGGKLTMGMTAHPKIDPVTGEVFSFRYGPIPPFLNYFRIGSDGSKQPDVPIFSFQQPSFVHDFAITQRYAIFPDMQIVMKPLDMLTGEGPPVGYDAGKVARIGVIPRYATDDSEMKWIEVPGFNFVHTVNAWDEKGGEEVVLVAANTIPVEHMLERMDLLHCCVEMVRINLKEGKVVGRKPLSTRNLEWGVINPKFLGRKNRFAFMAIGDPTPKVKGIVKLDFDQAGEDDCVVAARSFGERCFAGEPFFVGNKEGGDEDDGYVLTYTQDEGSGQSRFVVMDAKSPTLDIVASVRLPQRVPYGFHGLFVSEKDLQKQKNWKRYKN